MFREMMNVTEGCQFEVFNVMQIMDQGRKKMLEVQRPEIKKTRGEREMMRLSTPYSTPIIRLLITRCRFYRAPCLLFKCSDS